MQAQTIRRKVDTETYEDLASGTRPFTICLPDEDVQTDDYFVFVEMVDDQAGREVYRRVSIVTETDDLVVAGLVPIEYQALEGVFAQNGSLIAYAVEKSEDGIRVIEGPAFLPMLAAPFIDPHQLNDLLNIQVWPSAQYSILLKCQIVPTEDGRQDVTVNEVVVLCGTLRGEEDQPIFRTVDQRFLVVGKIKDEFGDEIEPHFMEIQADEQLSGDQQTEIDRVVALTKSVSDPSLTKEELGNKLS